MSVKRLSLHLDGDPLAHVLHPRSRIVILYLRYVEVTIAPIVNGRLILFIDWCQNLKVGLGVIPVVHRGRWGTMMTAVLLAPAIFLAVTTTITEGILFIQRPKSTVRLRICLFVHRGGRRRTRKSRGVRLSQEYVLLHCLRAYDLLV